jgi:hypothetical protein
VCEILLKLSHLTLDWKQYFSGNLNRILVTEVSVMFVIIAKKSGRVYFKLRERVSRSDVANLMLLLLVIDKFKTGLN